MEINATEVQNGQSFYYNGIEYHNVVIDRVTGRGRIVFYDDWDVRLEVEPLDRVTLI